MFAIVRTGGKQYRVAQGDVICVEKLEGSAGEQVALDDVLMLAGNGTFVLGRPRIEGAAVTARILEQGRDRKLIVFKYRRRKRYRRKAGHRQPFTRLAIETIKAPTAASDEDTTGVGARAVATGQE